MSDWTDRVVSDRMAVDREFSDRVHASEFSNQEWGLIMTAVEFEIERPDDPEQARIVPNTENLPQMMPELEKVQQAGPGGGTPQQDDGGGVLDAVRGALGLGDDGNEERLDAAEHLVGEYADALQARLEGKNKWADVREAYRDGTE
jgi:hypothetical protein